MPAAALVRDRVRMALYGYFYAYLAMLLGVVALAAGLKVAIGEIGARLPAGPAVLLGGGVTLYLAGDVAFRRSLRLRPVAYRAAAALVALATAALGASRSGLAQLVALLVALVVMLAAEARSSSRPPV
jgi:low temperature requirement protein LtrA